MKKAAYVLLVALCATCLLSLAATATGTVLFSVTRQAGPEPGTWIYTLQNDTVDVAIALDSFGVYDNGSSPTTILDSPGDWEPILSDPEDYYPDYWWAGWVSGLSNTPANGSSESGFKVSTAPSKFEVIYTADDSMEYQSFFGAIDGSPAVPEPSSLIALFSAVAGLGAFGLRKRA